MFQSLSKLSLVLISLFAFSACGAPSLSSSAQLVSQAFLPPDAISPKPCNGLQTQAALPPGAVAPKPCGCRSFSSQAALPPDFNPPSHPGSPTQPKPCKP